MGNRSRRERFKRLKKLCDGPNAALAILYAKRFLRRYPNYGPAWTRLGVSFVELARYRDAEKAFSNALSHCPTEHRHIVLGQLGHMAREAGEYELAADWYQKAIDAAPTYAGNYIYLGAVRAKQGKLTQAESAHRDATQCIEGSVDEAFLNLGFVLRAQERLEEAAECFREAITVDPGYRVARRALKDVELAIKAKQRGW